MMNNAISYFLLQGGNAGGGLGLIFLLPLVFIAMMYFQQRKQKRWQEVINNLKTGDRVTTSGGIRGTIIALRDDYIQLRLPPDNLRIEVTRASVASVATSDDKNNKAA